MNSILNKFPNRMQIAPVYALSVVIIYSWSLLHFFWRLPGFLYSSTAGEIAVTLAYLFCVNFLESVLVILATLFLSAILPQKWFHDRFVTKGILLVLLGLGYLIYFDSQLQPNAPFPYELAKWTPLLAVPVLVIVFVLDGIGFLDKFLIDLGDRLTIFLYLTIPLSALSFLVVLIRNLV